MAVNGLRFYDFRHFFADEGRKKAILKQDGPAKV